MQSRHAQTNDNTAEHTHLQSGNAKHTGGRVGGHCLHAATGGNHSGNGGVHHQIGNRTGQCRNILFPFCHTNGNAHGKQQRKVVKNRTAALVHNIQQCINRTARINDSGEMVCRQHGFVGERTSDAQQQTRDRQQCNGKHKRTSHALQYAENLIFHVVSSLSIFHTSVNKP